MGNLKGTQSPELLNGQEQDKKFFVGASKRGPNGNDFEDFLLTFPETALIIAPSTARALRQGSRGALFAFLRRLIHPIRTKALREKSTAEARPQRAGAGGSPAQETAERTLLSRERNAQASMGAGGDRYIAMACQSRKSGPQVVRAS